MYTEEFTVIDFLELANLLKKVLPDVNYNIAKTMGSVNGVCYMLSGYTTESFLGDHEYEGELEEFEEDILDAYPGELIGYLMWKGILESGKNYIISVFW